MRRVVLHLCENRQFERAAACMDTIKNPLELMYLEDDLFEKYGRRGRSVEFEAVEEKELLVRSRIKLLFDDLCEEMFVLPEWRYRR